ncbi:MAG: hypothetical protein O2892_00890 [Actinomycetota bacterium]|nr:hypothetical protein [Actinomycetota bacterium]MDA2947581.1 hypothetical protein [Actinomycetota bacterium]
MIALVVLSGCGAQDAKPGQVSSPQSASAASTSAPAGSPEGVKVSAADLPAIVANRTYRGSSDGMPYSEYYAADGSLRGISDGEAYSGSWKVVEDKLCFTYPTADASEIECYAVFKKGDSLTWIDSNGRVVQTSYVEGNPDGL